MLILEAYKKIVTKLTKNVKLQLQGKIRKIRRIWINYFIRKNGDLIETFKIINGFLIMIDIFQYFSNRKFNVEADYKI